MKRTTAHIIRDYGITIAVAIGIALTLRNFVIEAYKIPSDAMKPTLLAGDLIFVKKWSFQSGKVQPPERGDVVVFASSSPGSTTRPLFIRRVVGLPGDEIEVRDGMVLLNKKSLANTSSLKTPSETGNPTGLEKRVDTEAPPPPSVKITEGTEVFPSGKSYPFIVAPPVIENFGPQTVPQDFVFVIGDFRTQGELKNKKSWGLVPLETVKGKALSVWLSFEPSEKNSFAFPKFRLERMFRRIP
ncbi:MAG: signal peptidase I [Bdellovibrio sp.]|nr:signal peptidase I [Bdellovibrio sp.]